MADRRQRANRGGADARVAVAEHAADVRDPLLRDVAAHVAKRRQRAPANLRRLVVQEQRRHEIALVERFEDVDGVDDPRRIGVRQLLHERFDRRELRSAQPQFLRLDHAGGDAAAERGQVFALRAERHEVPDDRQSQADETELIPREPEAPRLNQHEHQQRREPARQPIDRDVHKRFHFLAQLRRERKEEHLAGRLVDRVAEGLVHHPRDRRGPEDFVEQDERGSGGEVGRQDEEGEADAEISMDAWRDPDLDHERGERRIEANLREETADGIFLPGALEDLGRHVHLLVEQQCAKRSETDHRRDQLNLPRFAEQRECAGEADATLFDVPRADRRGLRLAPENDRDDGHAGEEGECAPQQQGVGADRLDDRGGQERARHAAEHHASADEPKQPLRLSRIVDAVGQRPELADQQDAEERAPDIERDRHPVAGAPEERPEHDHHRRHAGLCDRQRPAAGQDADQPRVAEHQHADEQARAEDDPRHVHGAQAGDQLRAGQRLNDVVRRHGQEGVGEHQEHRRRFLATYVGDAPDDPMKKRHIGTAYAMQKLK